MRKYDRRTGENKKNILVALHPSVVNELDRVAGELGVSRSCLIEEYIQYGMTIGYGGNSGVTKYDENHIIVQMSDRQKWGYVKRWHPEVTWEAWLAEQELKPDK